MTEAVTKERLAEPVAWRVSDGDHWIVCANEYQVKNCLSGDPTARIQPLYLAPPSAPAASGNSNTWLYWRGRAEKAEAALAAREAERDAITRQLDQHSIAMPGGWPEHDLVSRVLVACWAAVDEEDKRRAEKAEADLSALREQTDKMRAALEPFAAAAMLYQSVSPTAKVLTAHLGKLMVRDLRAARSALTEGDGRP